MTTVPVSARVPIFVVVQSYFFALAEFLSKDSITAIICHCSKKKRHELECICGCTDAALIPVNFSEGDMSSAFSSLTGLKPEDGWIF